MESNAWRFFISPHFYGAWNPEYGIIRYKNLFRFQDGTLEFGIWNPASTGVQICFDFERESGIRNPRSRGIETATRGNPESGIRKNKKIIFLTIVNQGCWFQKQALEWLKSSALVLYVVTITIIHHLIMLWSTQGVGVITQCPCKGLQEWAG